ncbi:MAG: hypothetical protein AB3N15_14980 [Paracoccaceae bacterium]
MKFYSGIRLSLIAVAATCLVQSCTNPAREYTIEVEDRQPVDIDLGLGTFVDLCYGSAPAFEDAEIDRFSRDFERKPNGWFEHSKFALDFLLREHKDRYSCQFSFMSEESVQEFEKHMRIPFNAKEYSKAEFQKLIYANINSVPFENRVEKRFASRTKIDDAPAMFYGFVFSTPTIPKGATWFGVILQVDKD